MTRLDPIFALPPTAREYLDTAEYISVRIADLEEQIEQHNADAARKRAEIPVLQREVAEHERDAALAKLKLLELEAEAAQRKAGRQ